MSPHTQHRYLVAYDIVDDRRRTRIANTLQRYGDRVQYSVFVMDIKPAKLVRLRAQLRGIVDPTADSVLVCDLGPTLQASERRFSFIGRDRPVTNPSSFVL